ncbi:MAG: hypothetical protein CVV17_04150 [Gammaproteobacteria bacterium HGW-Gammaproteobacteria-7]|nr:MAG: hypothetical protein CVV17_04150 [Gammaproteobacteria bacterium HGW-Gammaproteobacteria-7]
MSRPISKIDRAPRLSAEDWANAALDQIAEQGLAGLAVESLARRIGVTKGSFYWHFPSREALLQSALERWEKIEQETVFGQLEAIAARLPHRPRKSEEQLASLLVPCKQGRLHWHWDPRLLDDVARNGDQLQDALLEAAARAEIPLLLISGGQSELINRDHIAEFLNLAPHAEHVQLADATHMLAGDDNDHFTDTVLAFLSRLPASQRRPPSSSTGDSP